MTKRGTVLILSLALLVIFAIPAAGQEADEWSQYQRNRGNTGYIDISVPLKNRIGHETGAIDARDGSQPVVSGKYAYIYCGVNDTSGALVCYDLTSDSTVWEKSISPPSANGSWSSPAVSEGVVFIGSGKNVYAFDAFSGTKKWTTSLGATAEIVNSSPAVDGNRLFIGDWANGKYLCLDTQTGGVVWERVLEAECVAQSTPAVDGDMVFVGQSAGFGASVSPNGKLWCLDKKDGKPVTSWGTNGYFMTTGKADVTGSVAVSGGYLYFTDFTFGVAADENSFLYCLDKNTGAELWKEPAWPSSGAPAVGEGKVVTSGNQWATWPDPSTNWTSAYNEETGSGGTTKLWSVKDVGGWTMSPSIASGTVSAGIFDSGLFLNSGVAVLDLDNGDKIWTSPEGGSTPVPTAYGLLSIDPSGSMVVFGGPSSTGLTRTFYSAEGTTRPGYQEWICLGNPTSSEIDTNIEYITATGDTRDQAVRLPANTRTTVDANTFMGPGTDISGIISGNGHFVAERAMYVNKNGITGGEQVMCKTSGELNHLFAEGCTREGYQTWLAIQNPGDSETRAIVTYFYSNKEAEAENIMLPAKTRTTINVNEKAGPGEDVSIALSSDKPTVAERVMYFNTTAGVNGVHNSTGTDEAGQNWYFAEGTTRGNFQEWLCLMNPSGLEASATVSYMTLDGQVIDREKTLPPNSRTTVNVNADIGFETDLSMNVASNSEIVAERPMYFSYVPQGIPGQVWTGGHNTMGARYAAYKWELAEGTTRDGFQTYLCVSNPNSNDADVKIDYITNENGNNESVTSNIKIPKNTRHTITVSDVIGFEKDVSVTITSTIPVIVERPMYFNSNGFVGGGVSLGLPGVP
ncbi:MAG: PQQ-binding-like beta-propeller repeat protein [Actinobacteria bacterium]|nr:PQQ-binding-like beta-propeller repeat protein [Actinomycetota bacterium]